MRMPPTFWKITTFDLVYVVPVKSTEEISQKFVAFSEYISQDLAEFVWATKIEKVAYAYYETEMTLYASLFKSFAFFTRHVYSCWLFKSYWWGMLDNSTFYNHSRYSTRQSLSHDPILQACFFTNHQPSPIRKLLAVERTWPYFAGLLFY